VESGPQIDVGAGIRLLITCKPTDIDEAAIRETLGAAHVASASAVARIFGVSYTTVKTSWRPGGMPGDAKAKVWPLADILIWLLKRDAGNAAPRTEDEVGKRKREAEMHTAEAVQRLKQCQAEKEEGRFVSVEVIRSEWSSWLAMHRDDVMSIPDDIKPMFPAKDAERLKDELERRLAKAYEALAERPMDEFIESLNDNPQEESI
jgi:phage terminase Nu1 subunit (DNA packaging protein)